ncbi:cysteine-rich KTR domain-containing protein [Clostridium neonatale]|nr:cysteine-rich KTR domain-containing protein [Clostridium neonatale]
MIAEWIKSPACQSKTRLKIRSKMILNR